MSAFFNSLTEEPMDKNLPAPPPHMPVPTDDQQRRIDALKCDIEDSRRVLTAAMPELDALQESWERRRAEALAALWPVTRPVLARTASGTVLAVQGDGTVVAPASLPPKDTYELTFRVEGQGFNALRLDVFRDDELKRGGPGFAGNGNCVLSEFEAMVVSIENPDESRPVKFRAAIADYSQKDWEAAEAIDGALDNGWGIGGAQGQDHVLILFAAEPFGFEGGTEIRVRLRQEYGARHLFRRFRVRVSDEAEWDPITLEPWWLVGPFVERTREAVYRQDFGPEAGVDLGASYHGDTKWQQRPDLKDGVKGDLGSTSYSATYLYRKIHTRRPRPLRLSLGSNDALKVWCNGDLVREWDRNGEAAPDQVVVTVSLREGENDILLKIVNETGGSRFYFAARPDHQSITSANLERVFQLDPDERSEADRARLRELYRGEKSPEWCESKVALDRFENQLAELKAALPLTLVMRERAQRRDTFVLARGEYDKKGEKVAAGVPAIFSPLPEGAKGTRLDFARWLVDPKHPLTARVTINRIWQRVFGTGLVKTAEDFGSQGEWPSHPELLDWLATEFVRQEWNLQAMIRLLVTSATYRQSSVVTKEHVERDPENRLLARSPRFRLEAEMLRDNALSVSGLLVRRLGGPGVRPYQPDGLWKAVAYTDSNTARFVQDHGDKLYRRGVYTFWKRTMPPPAMAIFDAPTREACVVKRARTNTPLQALVLMNDPQFVECARWLAQRVLHEGGDAAGSRIDYLCRLVLARPPSPAEAELLGDLFKEYLNDYRSNPDAAKQLVGVGEAPRVDGGDIAALASWTMLSNLVLNLDETVTKS